MYKLHTERDIAVAHRLIKHDGKCQKLHGHNILLKVDIKASELIRGGSSDGMVIDFGTIKKILDKLDHEYINEFFQEDRLDLRTQPTAERLAKYFAEEIYRQSNNPYIYEVTVEVHEAKNQYAVYTHKGE